MMAGKDRELEKQIKQLHNPSGIEIDVRSLLQLVKRITSMISIESQENPEEGNGNSQDEKILPLSITWRQLSLAALKNMREGVDSHTITLSVLKELTQFGWDAKAVMILASFALNHCLWLVAQMYSASSPALQEDKHNKFHIFLSSWLKEVSDVDPYYFYLSLTCSISKKPKASQLPKPALTKIFQELVEVVECIIELEELPSTDLQGFETQYENAMADIPITVYHFINTVIYCSALIQKFPFNDYEISGAEESELNRYTRQLKTKRKNFTNQIRVCNQFLEETKVDITYQIPIAGLKDNRKALEFLMEGDVDQHLRNEVDKIIKQLKGKNVMLLVSDDKISAEDLFIVDRFYSQITSQPLPVKSGREADELSILWIPLYFSLRKEQIEYCFQEQKELMRWFTVPHPSVVSKEATYFIKEKWQLQSKSSILVMLDPQGTVLNINAVHMICTWGGIAAFPFTRSKERALWKSETFTMKFIIDGIDSRAYQSVIEEKEYVIIYGGDDIDWIRKFTAFYGLVYKRHSIRFMGLYIGKPNHHTSNKKIKEIIKEENISHTLPDYLTDWFFWSRVRSMVISKMSHQKGSETEDWMTRQLKLLLSYETERSWALIGRENKVQVHGPGGAMMEMMMEFNAIPVTYWKYPSSAVTKVFEPAIAKVAARGNNSCCEIAFPVRCTGMPETLKCPNPHCKLEEMDRRIVFECCHPVPKLKKKQPYVDGYFRHIV